MSIIKTLSLLTVLILLFTVQSQAGITHTTASQQLNNTTDGLEGLTTIQNINQTNQQHSLQTLNQELEILTNDLYLSKITTQTTTLALNNSKLLNQPGLPLLPMKTFTFNFPLETTIHSITIKDTTIQELGSTIHFQTTPQPHFYSINTTPQELNSQKIIQENLNIKYENKLYPGATHNTVIGKNTTHTNLVVHYYPIQTNLATNTNYLITKATLEIIYSAQTPVNSQPLLSNPENIIITHPDFLSQATQLADFHNNQGTPTEVVTTEWIDSNMQPSESPPIMGYKDFKLMDKLLKYDEQLALKTISYLQSQQSNPNLTYVTIIGNAIHVPPSYYFGFGYYPVPTDFYYSSPDLDLIANYRIGRIPVHTTTEAETAINKIIEWIPSPQQMNTVGIAGGIPFNSPYYIGELITIDSANRGYFDGLSLEKYYRTDDSFHDSNILSALQSDIGMLYMICHGSTDVVAVEEGRISTKTVEDQPKNTNAPILSCIACSSGAYDTYLIRQGYDFERTSVGEAFVIEEGGAIAYIGGSRTNNGYPIFTLNKGRVEISKETYMAGLLNSVNEAYHSNVEALGDLCFFAAEQYLLDNDMTDYWNQYHYMDFILLGDPALKLPQRSFEQPIYQHPTTQMQQPLGYLHYDDSEYNGTIGLLPIEEDTTYLCFTNSSTLDLKAIETGDYQDVEVDLSTHTTDNNTATIIQTASAGEMNLLRFISEDGKEDWMYAQPIRPVDDDYSSQTPGYGVTRWSSLSDALAESDDYDTLFLFNGTYTESISIQQPCTLQGEDKSTTLIDGQGEGTVLSIETDGTTIKGLTFTNSGDDRDDAGLLIQPPNIWNSQPILIQDCVFSDNQNGIYLTTKLPIFSAEISVKNNLVENNQNGIYIKNSKSPLLVSGNLIQNNEVGISFKHVNKALIQNNDFIDNDRHCKIIDMQKSIFTANYWDNWIGHRFNTSLPLPKIINGITGTRLRVFSQIKIDFNPSSQQFN